MNEQLKVSNMQQKYYLFIFVMVLSSASAILYYTLFSDSRRPSHAGYMRQSYAILSEIASQYQNGIKLENALPAQRTIYSKGKVQESTISGFIKYDDIWICSDATHNNNTEGRSFIVVTTPFEFADSYSSLGLTRQGEIEFVYYTRHNNGVFVVTSSKSDSDITK
jgi:hypothetical protein